MTMYLNPKSLVFGEFGCLEPAQTEWLNQVEYWEDFNRRFFRSNGAAYDTETDSNVMAWLQAPDRAPFSAMANALISQLEGKVDLSDINLVLLAHWMPDLHLGTSVTNYAQHRLGLSEGFGFAISDRGRSAPLFALQCAARYLRDGRKRALLMVMDQKHLLYRSPVVERFRPQNAASLMVLDAGDSEGFQFSGYFRRSGIGLEQVGEALTDICTENGLDRSCVTVIVDPEVAGLLGDAGPVLVQNPRFLCASPFALLAEYGDDLGDVILTTFEANELSAVCLHRSGGIVQ